MKSVFVKYTAVTLVSASLLSACQTTNKYGYDYSDDVCKPQRDSLLDQQDYFADDLIKGALVGAAVGAAGGALGAFLSGGNAATGAAVGAIGGAIAGAGAAYWNYLAKQSGSQSELLSTMLLDMETDAERLARTQKALDDLVACRTREANTIKADYKAKRIDLPTAKAKMATLNAKLKEDLRVARDINKNVADRKTNFDVAAQQVGAKKKTKSDVKPIAVSAENKAKQRRIAATYSTVEKNSAGVASSTNQLASLEQSTSGDGGFSTTWLLKQIQLAASAPAPEACQ